ncbi:MAG TPA: hypothetical protein VL358_03155 [Caulobacteraceae bacterium]|jgi:hypothetical protein|nr:hypothetical protein [Caulobacteraceae bacterium]
MTLPLIQDWDAAKAAAFGRETLAFRHDLHHRPMFEDGGLIEVLDRYPRDKLGVFTMGDDPVAWRSWRRGTAEGLTGSELMEAVKAGRIWLNLREVNSVMDSYAGLAREIFGDIEAHTGVKTFRHDVGLLISSPCAQVFYHLDATPVTLWQIRGEKRMWVYPRQAPFVTDEEIERIVLRETAEQFPYRPEFDAGAEVHEMTPGVMVNWPQNAPHRLVNGPMVNVSLSIEYLTPAAMLRANVIYANGVMRRRLGARPKLAEGYTPANLAKFGLARTAKALKLQTTVAKTPPSFRLSAGRLGEIAEL